MRDRIRDFALSFTFFLAVVSGMTTACGKAKGEATSGATTETLTPMLDVEASDGRAEDPEAFLAPVDSEDRAPAIDDEVAADAPL